MAVGWPPSCHWAFNCPFLPPKHPSTYPCLRAWCLLAARPMLRDVSRRYAKILSGWKPDPQGQCLEKFRNAFGPTRKIANKIACSETSKHLKHLAGGWRGSYWVTACTMATIPARTASGSFGQAVSSSAMRGSDGPGLLPPFGAADGARPSEICGFVEVLWPRALGSGPRGRRFKSCRPDFGRRPK